MEKYKFIGLALLVAASFSAGRFLGPKQVETKEVEKIVYRDREVKDESKDTKSTRKEVIRPDGTREIEIVREAQTQKHSDTSREQVTEKTSETKTLNAPDWSLGLYRGQDYYLATLDRRIAGSLFLGVYARSDLKTKPEVGVGIRLEF